MMSVTSSDENLKRISALKELIQQNSDRRNDLRKLRVQGVLDAVAYNQERNRIEKQSENARREIQSLGNMQSGILLRETEQLLRFVESSDMLDTYDEALFLAFVDSIVVNTRTSVSFRLKCGLTFKEELCTDTKS